MYTIGSILFISLSNTINFTAIGDIVTINKKYGKYLTRTKTMKYKSILDMCKCIKSPVPYLRVEIIRNNAIADTIDCKVIDVYIDKKKARMFLTLNRDDGKYLGSRCYPLVMKNLINMNPALNTKTYCLIKDDTYYRNSRGEYIVYSPIVLKSGNIKDLMKYKN